MSADGSAVCRIRRTGGPAPGREPPTKLAADALAALCAAVLTPTCTAPEPQGVLADAAASTSMTAQWRANRQPAVVSFVCTSDGTVAAQLLWAEVPDWSSTHAGTGGNWRSSATAAPEWRTH